MAWFRLPTDVFRSQHFSIRSTMAAGRNLGSAQSDQLGTVGTLTTLPAPARRLPLAPLDSTLSLRTQRFMFAHVAEARWT